VRVEKNAEIEGALREHKRKPEGRTAVKLTGFRRGFVNEKSVDAGKKGSDGGWKKEKRESLLWRTQKVEGRGGKGIYGAIDI